jgi:hypothetical protein
MKRLLFLLLILPLLAGGQPLTDFAARAAGGKLELLLIPQGAFSGWATNLQFTLSWPSGGAAPSLSQPALAGSYLPIAPAGAPAERGGRLYQKYAGFGLVSLAQAGASWQAGDSIAVAQVGLPPGSPPYRVEQDAWVSENNGSIYVELNGVPVTGALSTSLEAQAAGGLAIFPNPAASLLHVRPPAALRGASLALLNAEGRQVLLLQAERLSAGEDWQFPLPPLPPGIYFLRLSGLEGARAVQWGSLLHVNP